MRGRLLQFGIQLQCRLVELVFGAGLGNQSAQGHEGGPGIAGVPRLGHDLLRLQLDARFPAGLAVQVCDPQTSA
jgi:hypothetical protein